MENIILKAMFGKDQEGMIDEILGSEDVEKYVVQSAKADHGDEHVAYIIEFNDPFGVYRFGWYQGASVMKFYN